MHMQLLFHKQNWFAKRCLIDQSPVLENFQNTACHIIYRRVILRLHSREYCGTLGVYQEFFNEINSNGKPISPWLWFSLQFVFLYLYLKCICGQHWRSSYSQRAKYGSLIIKHMHKNHQSPLPGNLFPNWFSSAFVMAFASANSHLHLQEGNN